MKKFIIWNILNVFVTFVQYNVSLLNKSINFFQSNGTDRKSYIQPLKGLAKNLNSVFSKTVIFFFTQKKIFWKRLVAIVF